MSGAIQEPGTLCKTKKDPRQVSDKKAKKMSVKCQPGFLAPTPMTRLLPVQLPEALHLPSRGDLTDPLAVHDAVGARGGCRHLTGGGDGGPVQPQQPQHSGDVRGQVDAQRQLLLPQHSQQVHAAAAENQPLQPRAAAGGQPAGRRSRGVEERETRVVPTRADGRGVVGAAKDDRPNELHQHFRDGAVLDQDQSSVPSPDGPNCQRGHERH